MSESPRQLGLAISLRDEARFSNFHSQRGANDEALSYLSSLVSNRGNAGLLAQNLLLWGEAASGLSHLLQAVCNDFVSRKFQVQYLPLSVLLDYSPNDICDGLADCDLVCIDDIHLIKGHRPWQESVFVLFNQLRDANKCFVCAAHTSPSELPIELADLRSRLLSGTVFHIKALDELGLKSAFKQRASDRGMELSEEVVNFIYHRAPRSTHFLFNFLDKLDQQSLAEKRKVTIPFVREMLASGVA